MIDKLPDFICIYCQNKLLHISNNLVCNKCKKNYPVVNGIPSFLSKDTFKQEEKQYKLLIHVSKKQKQINFHLRRLPAKILLKKGFNHTDIGLDIGVGTGINENFEHIYTKVSKKIVAIDVSSSALIRFKKNFPDCLCLLSDACQLPFKNLSFDFVTASGLIHHFIGQKKKLTELFKMVYRILKKRGMFIINEPNLFFPPSLILYLPNLVLQKIIPGARGRVPYERPIHYFEIKSALQKAGFNNINMEASSFAHYYMPQCLIKFFIRYINRIRNKSPWKYFGSWITVYACK